jgi:methylated-DNA-protein-cysteine methyltransferase-like protein
VTTYGALAAALGYPRGARMVGWIMNVTPRSLDVPAHRVVGKDGALTGGWAFGSRERMQSLLEAEGIAFTREGRVDMARFGWDPSRDLDDAQRRAILEDAAALTVVPPARLLGQLSGDPASPFKDTS